MKKLGSGDKIGLGIFAFLILVTGVALLNPSKSSTKTQTTTKSPIVKTKEITPVENTQDMLWKAVDKSIRTRKDVTVEIDSGTAMMTFYKDTYLNENHMVKDAYTAFVNFGIEAFKIPDVREVNVQSRVDLTDQFGKQTRETVVSVTMDKPTFEKFTWDNLRNVKSVNIYQVMKDNAQLHFISPAIMKNVDASDLWIK